MYTAAGRLSSPMTRKRIGRPIGSTKRQRGPVRANLEAVRNVAASVYLIRLSPDPTRWLPSKEHGEDQEARQK
jgi:hypothetical protein